MLMIWGNDDEGSQISLDLTRVSVFHIQPDYSLSLTWLVPPSCFSYVKVKSMTMC